MNKQKVLSPPIVKDFEAVVQMDLDYQHQWSVTYDLYLLVKTLQVVLAKHGAY